MLSACHTFLGVVLLFLVLMHRAAAGAYEDGLVSYYLGEYKTAYSLLRPLAEQGDARAQAALGDMHVYGEGCPEDGPEALRWYRKAADQGNARAQYSLGVMYANGGSVPKDNVQAYMWLHLAAMQEHKVAAPVRDIVAQLMTPAQIAEAQALSRNWEPKK